MKSRNVRNDCVLQTFFYCLKKPCLKKITNIGSLATEELLYSPLQHRVSHTFSPFHPGSKDIITAQSGGCRHPTLLEMLSAKETDRGSITKQSDKRRHRLIVTS